MEKDSIPEENAGVQDEHSQQNNSADTTDESQSSNEEDNQFFGNEEQEETSDGAPSQTQTGDDETSTESNDESGVEPELKKWAESQNISLETETEIKLAKRLRDTQKGFHEAKAESKQKFNDATDESTKGDQMARIEAKLARSDFFEANPDARELEGVMFDLALEARDSGDTDGFKYYQTPQGWKTLYRIAKANQLDKESNESYESGRNDERKNLAKKQQASKAPSGAQKTSPESTKVTDEQIGAMSLAEYQQFRADNPDWDPFRS